MNDRDITAILRGLTPVLREHFEAFASRIVRDAEQAEALRSAEHRAFMAEERERMAGMFRQVEERLASIRDGRDGIDGRDGADGNHGADGATGADGRDGVDGINGKDGLPGLDGKDGKDGVDGADGRDGADGSNGQDGAPGVDGAPGENGRDGIDGQNGRDGADAYHGRALGLFDPDATYRALDVVSLNGSEWRAKSDAPGALPGPGWMLSASKGKRGERGDPGQIGKEGPAGAAPVALYAEGEDLVLTLSDGAELKVNLRSVADFISRS